MIVGPFTATVGDYPDDTTATVTTRVLGGIILEVYLSPQFLPVYGGSSMDVDIATSGRGVLPAKDILVGISALAADGVYRPRDQVQGADGEDLAGVYSAGVTVHDSITIDVSGGDIATGDALLVWFWILLD